MGCQGRVSFVLKWLETAKLVCEGAQAFKEMDKALICSKGGQEVLAGRFDQKQIAIVLTTIGLPDMLRLWASDNKLRLLFAGTPGYPPNEGAVKWLTESILPEIERRLRVCIVTRTVVGHASPR